jgi:hypothetical protein
VTRIVRIVSGGQTGADRAALDVAIELGVGYGGWCPAGGWAEDLPDPPGLLARYPHLREAESREPDVRTRLNVRDSDATLIVRRAGVQSSGSDLTLETAQSLGRPALVTDGDVDTVVAWLRELGGDVTLNVAGPRASGQPGVYETTRRLLLEVLAVLAEGPHRLPEPRPGPIV